MTSKKGPIFISTWLNFPKKIIRRPSKFKEGKEEPDFKTSRRPFRPPELHFASRRPPDPKFFSGHALAAAPLPLPLKFAIDPINIQFYYQKWVIFVKAKNMFVWNLLKIFFTKVALFLPWTWQTARQPRKHSPTSCSVSRRTKNNGTSTAQRCFVVATNPSKEALSATEHSYSTSKIIKSRKNNANRDYKMWARRFKPS